MMFLKWSMLLGLAAVAIPIAIHLLNRNQPRTIEWGAMQFLRAALVTRRRLMQMEEMVLLCLRCLALALLALAMARPFLPGASAVPWAVVIPSILVAATLAGMAATLWNNPALRRRLLKTAAALAALAILFAALERWIQARRWLTRGSGRDTVIVLDGSMSMSLETGGQSVFQRAVGEARALIKSARRGDAFAVVLAGAVPEALVARPTSSRAELLAALDGPACRVVGGRMSAPEAVNLAAALLGDGPNAAKQVVMFTDGQAAGWDARAEARWQFVAGALASLSTPARLVVRRLPTPPDFRNAAVTAIQLSRRVIGTDRPVKIDVSVLNAGGAPLQPSAVELFVDSNRVERIPIVKELLPQSTEIFRFDYQFDRPGYHVLQAEILTADSLPRDNGLAQVAYVLDRLPVLLVEGASSERFFFRRATGFVRTALTPDGRADSRGAARAENDAKFLVDPTVVEASDLPTLPRLDPYRAIILADVPRLPTDQAQRLAAFVEEGGGLLVTPGRRALPEFYNVWQGASGEAVMPAALRARVTPADPVRLKVESMTHPALRLVARREQSDVALGFVSTYWAFAVDPATTRVRVGAELESGDPWLLERPLGRGDVLATATAFDRRDSTLPSLKCFVPLVHELVYYLAAPQIVAANVAPGTEWTLAGRLAGTDAAIPPLTVLTPAGDRRPAVAALRGRDFALRFAETRRPGLYRVQVPPPLAAATGVASGGLAGEIPFAVNAMPEESTLTPLSDSDLAVLRRQLDLFTPERFEELLAALAGEVPGQELWRILTLCALAVLLLETALARWITAHRRLHKPAPVVLPSPAENMKAARARLTELLAAPPGRAGRLAATGRR